MRESEDGFKRFKAFTRSGEPYSFSVVICADALTLGTAGKADIGLSDTEYDNFMVITVACSTNPDAFEGTANLFALQGIPMLICNASQYGGSGIFLPETVRERFTNIPGQPSSVQAHSEMLMLLDFLPSQFSVKKGVLDKSVRGSWAMCPICYGRNQIWRSDYLQTLDEIEKCLQADDIIGAADYAEILRSLHEGQLPPALEAAFNSFIAHTANLCGDTQICILQLKAVLLDIHSTQGHLYSEFPEMIDFCVKMGRAMALPQINSLIEQQEKYPEESLTPIQPTLPTSITRASPTESENIEFRDRGNYMNQLQDAITNPAAKLILVSGAYGIGKSSTVSMSFKRNLPNWSVQWISLTSTTRFSMVLEYMANAIGHSLKADTLARNSKKVLKPILELFSKKLFAKDGRVIVVDQMENILLGLQGRDHTLLTLFLNAVCSLQGGQGKVIFISDIRFSKEVFPENPAVIRIVMGRIPDNRYVKLILEYEMRKRNMISPGQTPDIPNKLYELVNGHPLTAKLSIDVIARHSEKVKVIDTIDLGQVREQIIKQLMERINLDEVETRLMHVLSVFRTVINIPRLNRCLPQELCDLLGENIKRLFQMSFISAGEDTLEITAVFRNYYYEQISKDKKIEYHEYALQYYVNLHKELEDKRQFSAVVYAEIAYHLTSLNRIGQLKNYLPGNMSTLKQLAWTLYQRDKNYETARHIYHMLNAAYPNDVEVLSYLGRCYARADNWEQTEKYFKEAIAKAEQQGENTWYLYRDWGHLNVRFYMDEDAQNHLSTARALLLKEFGQQDDAGILAAEGFLRERNNDIPGAIKKYETALKINKFHEFTISNYAKLLRKLGKAADADKLEGTLDIEDLDNLGESTDSVYSGFDIIDIDTDLYDD